MALCASVMTGIYASPVMADELWVNGNGTYVNNKLDNGVEQITSLEGLKEITLGDSVRIIAGGGGIIRVGDVNGVNTRVHDDGFYINETGNDRKTSLTAGILTLAGNNLTSAQLDNINNVIGENGVIKAANGAFRVNREGAVKAANGAFTVDKNGNTVSKGDVTSTAADGTTTYNLNTVGKNTSGITIDSEGKVTTIEGAFSVDEKGHIYNKNRSFQVTKDGAARFGARSGVNVRMENGVLSINSEGTNAVASLSKDGLMLSDSVNGQQTLTAAKIEIGRASCRERV